jgi:hypothetical protein
LATVIFIIFKRRPRFLKIGSLCLQTKYQKSFTELSINTLALLIRTLEAPTCWFGSLRPKTLEWTTWRGSSSYCPRTKWLSSVKCLWYPFLRWLRACREATDWQSIVSTKDSYAHARVNYQRNSEFRCRSACIWAGQLRAL